MQMKYDLLYSEAVEEDTGIPTKLERETCTVRLIRKL